MATCIHGFEQGQCLICQTLSSGPGDGGATRTRSRRHRSSERERIPAGPVDVLDDDRGVAARHGSTGTHLLVGAVLVVLAVIGFWILAGVVFAVLRLLEIVIVGAVAGVVGYRLGRARGHHDR